MEMIFCHRTVEFIPFPTIREGDEYANCALAFINVMICNIKKIPEIKNVKSTRRDYTWNHKEYTITMDGEIRKCKIIVTFYPTGLISFNLFNLKNVEPFYSRKLLTGKQMEDEFRQNIIEIIKK